MINNNSVKKMHTIKTILLVVWIITIVLGTVVGILAITGLALDEKQPADVYTLTGAIIGLILGLAAFVILGYAILCLFNYFILKRQENIDYMNARLAHIKNKEERAKARDAAIAAAVKRSQKATSVKAANKKVVVKKASPKKKTVNKKKKGAK